MKSDFDKVMQTPYGKKPKKLKQDVFFGLETEMDGEQKAFRDAIWNDEKLIVFCNAKSGTGKTTIATATAVMLCQYGVYDGIVYVASPIQEQKQGYLSGSIEEKSEPYFAPFYDALLTANVQPSQSRPTMTVKKEGGLNITAITHTFLRGCNLQNKVVIIDEAQNYSCGELKKVLTRIHDDCKTIVIGHSEQIDIPDHPEKSGFVDYLMHFTGDDRTEICHLTVNHRGWISTHADNMMIY